MILLVDGNNLARRAFATMVLTNPNGKDVSAIYGTLKMVKSAIEKLKPEKVIVAWDVGKSAYRCKLFDGYKANRKQRTPEEEDRYKTFNSQTLEIRMALEYLGVINVWQQGIEADDLMYAIIRKNRKKKITVLTNDRDLLQVINSRVSVYLPLFTEKGKTFGKLITESNFKDAAKVSTVERFIQYKTLVGDPSDGIPGVKGIGEKSALMLLEEKGYDIGGILENPPKEVLASKRLSCILTSQKLLVRNNKLVRLADAYVSLVDEMGEAMERLEEPPMKSYASFKKFCLSNSFVSILSEMNQWRSVFESVGEQE